MKGKDSHFPISKPLKITSETKDTTEIQRVIRDYNKQLNANKFDNLGEMDKFLETYNLPRLNHEEIENRNRPVTSKEIESQQTKVQDQMASLMNSTKHSKKNEYQFFSNSSKKQKRREHFQTHSMRPALPWPLPIPKPDKDTARKEKYRSVSLMNIDIKIST